MCIRDRSRIDLIGKDAIILKDGKLVAVGSPKEVMSENFIADTFEVDILQGQANSESFIMPWKIR